MNTTVVWDIFNEIFILNVVKESFKLADLKFVRVIVHPEDLL